MLFYLTTEAPFDESITSTPEQKEGENKQPTMEVLREQAAIAASFEPNTAYRQMKSERPATVTETLSSVQAAQAEEKLAAMDAKVEDLCHLLKFLLAQDYLPRSTELYISANMDKILELKYSRWHAITLRKPWNDIIRPMQDPELLILVPNYTRISNDYLFSPAKALGVNPADIISRIKTIPVSEHGNIFSLLGQYIDGGYWNVAKRRLDIDEQWLTLCFRTEKQRQSYLYKSLKQAHAAQKAKVLKAVLGTAPSVPSRGSFSSDTTLLGVEVEEKKGEDTGMDDETEKYAKKEDAKTKVAEMEVTKKQDTTPELTQKDDARKPSSKNPDTQLIPLIQREARDSRTNSLMTRLAMLRFGKPKSSGK